MMIRRNYRRFNLIFFPLIALNLVSIALFNLAVDPYGMLKNLIPANANQAQGKNSPTPAPKSVQKPIPKKQPKTTTLEQRNKHRAERFKINLTTLSFTRIQPKTIVLGTSTALKLSPEHPAFTIQPAYNLALPGAKMRDIKSYFDDTLANNPNLKQVAIGLDLFAFGGAKRTIQPAPEKSKPVTVVRQNKYSVSFHELFKVVFSLDTLQASLKKIVIPDKASQQLEGVTLNQTDKKLKKVNSKVLPAKISKASPKTIKKPAPKPVKKITPTLPKKTIQKPASKKHVVVYKNNEKLTNFRRVITLYLTEKNLYKNYNLSQEELDNFKAIVEACKKRNITLKVFFSPVHASQLEVIHGNGLWPAFEEWKRQIVKITPAWDFSDYNGLTTEPINNRMENFVDSVHYQDRIADLILNRLYNYQPDKVPANFGRLIIPTHIEAHLKTIRNQRQTWVKNYPETVQFVQDIKKQMNRKSN